MQKEYRPGFYIGHDGTDHQPVHICYEDPGDEALRGWVHVIWPGGGQAYLPVLHIRPMRVQEWRDEAAEARKVAVIELSRAITALTKFVYPTFDLNERPLQSVADILAAWCAFDAYEIIKIAGLAMAESGYADEASQLLISAALFDQPEVVQPETLPESKAS